jgi:hypothetical protein
MISAAAAKRGTVRVKDVLPREGTVTRKVYDMFMASRGVPIAFSHSALDRRHKCNMCSILEALRSRYGLDIRVLEPGKWVLAGEWFGKNYIDYIAAHLNEDAA